MKNGELDGILMGLTSESVRKITGKPAFAIVKNKKMIESELENIKETLKPSEEFLDYDNRRVAICQKHSEKDEDGNAKIEGNKYVIIKSKKKAMEKSLEKLREECKDVIASREAQMEGLKKVIESDVEIEFIKVKESQLKEDEMTVESYEAISFMIED